MCTGHISMKDRASYEYEIVAYDNANSKLENIADNEEPRLRKMKEKIGILNELIRIKLPPYEDFKADASDV